MNSAAVKALLGRAAARRSRTVVGGPLRDQGRRLTRRRARCHAATVR
jgi:hypothetical protein